MLRAHHLGSPAASVICPTSDLPKTIEPEAKRLKGPTRCRRLSTDRIIHHIARTWATTARSVGELAQATSRGQLRRIGMDCRRAVAVLPQLRADTGRFHGRAGTHARGIQGLPYSVDQFVGIVADVDFPYGSFQYGERRGNF